MIGKAAYPRIFKQNKIILNKLPARWKNNRKAWMYSTTFLNWLEDASKIMRKAGRKNVLFMDNASSHSSNNLSNIKLVYLPPNMTSELQPMDKGIIQAFKLLYRKSMRNCLFTNAESCKNAHEFAKSINLLDAINWISYAWEKINQSTIVKCFHHCGFLIPDNPYEKIQDIIENEEIETFSYALKIESSEIRTFLCQDNSDLQIHEDEGDSEDKILESVLKTYTNGISEISSNIECESDDNVEEEKPITYEDVLKGVSNIEKFSLINSPELMNKIYRLKEALISKHQARILNNLQQTEISRFLSS